jgi:hypothetical protein
MTDARRRCQPAFGPMTPFGEREHHELGACLELQLAHDVRAVRVDAERAG